jgi:hypothetical protein
MSRLIPLAAAIAFVAPFPALAAERNFPTGGGFERLSNSTPFDVYVHTGKAPSVHAVGNDEALNQLQIENRGGELHIGTKPGRWFSGWHWGRGQRARIDVTVPMVSAANLSGPGNLTVDAVRTRAFSAHLSGPGNINIGMVEAGVIDVHLSGPGDISIAGRAERATMNLSGPGNIHASRLALGDATVNLSGPGDIDATVSRTADVRLSGPGDVNIRGGARCSIHKSGPGSVNCG